MCEKFIVIPDIQFYTGESENFRVLEEMMGWILERSEQISAVLQLGDLTHTNSANEWVLARRAFSKLDGRLPYFLSTGNHDLGFDYLSSDRYTPFSTYFCDNQNPLNVDALITQLDENCLQNALYRFQLNNTEWQALTLEFGPRDETLEWAREVIAQYSERPTILITHDLIDHYSTFSSQTGEASRSQLSTPGSPPLFNIANHPGGANCGEEVWNKFLKDASNICLTFNGHHKPFKKDLASGNLIDAYHHAQSRRLDFRNDGSVCQQVLFNSQWEPNGGNGLMLEVTVNDSQASVEVVSPCIDPSTVETFRPEDLTFDLKLNFEPKRQLKIA